MASDRLAAGISAVLIAALPALAYRQEIPQFVDVASQAGINLRNVSGAPSKDYIVESVGAGAAFLDFDRDDDLDVLLVNGSTLERLPAGDPMLALFRNDGDRFTDITAAAGLTAAGWGMGVCVADYDNDRDPDVYVTAYGANRLYRNNGDETFSDVTSESGTGDPRWGTNCAFGDYDRDGDLDLYVANYLTFSRDRVPNRGEAEICSYMGADVFCGPRGLAGEPDILFRNDGAGFSDVTAEAGIDDPGHYGFGVLFGDLDRDGWPDIYVANDSVPNLFFRNNGDGTLTDIGLMSGVALGDRGQQQAGMGVDSGDYDRDGRPDIVVTNFSQDTNTLYRNIGESMFIDVTAMAGLSRTSFPNLGWGTGLVDVDNDGWLDLFVSNGHIYPQITSSDSGSAYLQPKELYRNLGDGSFQDVTGQAGADLAIPKPARGTAFGDYDNDGDIDVLVVNIDQPPSLYRNDGGNRRRWVSLRLEGTDGNRDGVGAWVELETGDGRQAAEVRSGGSYLSHNDTRLHFGLGDAVRVEAVRIRWPNGNTETLGPLEADRFVTIREGAGVTASRPADSE